MTTKELERAAKIAWHNFNIDTSKLETYQDINWYIKDFKIGNHKFQDTLEGFRAYFVMQMTNPGIYKDQKISKQRAEDYIKDII